MTFLWTATISEEKWKRIRKELVGNRLTMPFSNGMAQNRKTGYKMENRYDRDTSRLEIKVSYPGHLPFDATREMFNTIFGCQGMAWPVSNDPQ